MPQVYTVTTKNAFAALDDSDTEDVIMTKPQNLDQPQAAPAPASTPEKNNKRPPRPNRENNRERKPREEGEATRFPPRRQPTAEGEDTGKPLNRVAREPRRARVGTREFVPPREEKRVFDKQSGTGRGKEVKKQGGGAYNWGNESPDFGAPAEATKPGEWGAPEWNAPVEGQETAENVAVVTEPEAPKTMTYEQYQAQFEKPSLNVTPVLEVAEQTLPAGYEEYRKEETVTAPKKKDEGAAAKKPKAMHLAELAAQSGVQLNYGGPRRGGVRPPQQGGERRGAERKGGDVRPPRDEQRASPKETKETKTPTRDLDLSDSQAFPTLEAH